MLGTDVTVWSGTVRPGGEERTSRIVGRLAAFWERRRRAAETRRQARLLTAFDDRLLKDVWLSREQVEALARYGDCRE